MYSQALVFYFCREGDANAEYLPAHSAVTILKQGKPMIGASALESAGDGKLSVGHNFMSFFDKICVVLPLYK